MRYLGVDEPRGGGAVQEDHHRACKPPVPMLQVQTEPTPRAGGVPAKGRLQKQSEGGRANSEGGSQQSPTGNGGASGMVHAEGLGGEPEPRWVAELRQEYGCVEADAPRGTRGGCCAG